jgi:thiamine pyrophosphate-dependent acetolactate synthase large subunit-like protein
VKRYDCLQSIAALVGDAIAVSSAGGVTLEWSNVRPSDANLRVRTLGLCSSIGLGLAMTLPRRKILVLDGDGALLLNLSSLPTLGWQRPPNLIHCVFVNGIYEASGGGRNATSANADLVAMARGAGVPHAVWVETVEDFRQEVAAALDRDQLSFIAARVEPGVRPGLKSIDTQAVENKFLLARHIERTEGIQVLAPAYPRH